MASLRINLGMYNILILILSGMLITHVGESSPLSIGFRDCQGSHKCFYIVCKKSVIF